MLKRDDDLERGLVMGQKNRTLKIASQKMKEISIWFTFTLIMTFIFTGQHNVAQADIKVTEYSSTIDIQDDGAMQQSEVFAFDVKGTVDQVEHRIALSDMGKVSNIGVEMKSVSADAFFPFVESDSNEVGTFTIADYEDGKELVMFNTMTDAPHITQVSTTLTDVWTNYSEWTIMNNSFLALPYAVDQARLTLNFPSAVAKENQSDMILSSPVKTTTTWSEDRTSVTIEAQDLAAGQTVNLQMYMPVSILPNNQKVGADSEGKAIVESMQASREAETNLQRRMNLQIWAVSGILFVLILAYTIYLYMKKRQTFAAVPENKSNANTKPNEYSVHTVAKLMGKKYKDSQKIVLLILEMVERQTIAAHFITNKAGQIADIQVAPLQHESSLPAGQLLLTEIQQQMSHKDAVISLNDLVFNSASGKVTMLSRFGRKLVRKIEQTAKVPLKKEGLYSKMNQVYITILTLYMVAWLFGTGFVIYWQYQQGTVNIWASILIVLSILLVILLQQNVLPLRSEKGVSLFRQWHAYLKQVLKQTSKSEVWQEQSGEALDEQYLYSWIAGTNVKVAKAVDGHPQVVQLPLMGSAQAISHLQLSNLKWQADFSDADIETK